TLIYSIRNPMTSSTIVDWRPLITSIRIAPAGSLEQKYFVLVLIFFAAAALSVILTPKGDDAPLVAVAAVLVATAFQAQRNIALAAIAVAPVFANHLALLLRTADRTGRPPIPLGARLIPEILIAAAAIGFARYSGVLKPGIDASGNPTDAISFMKAHDLTGNVLADYGWGEFIIWHGTPRTKVFIDGRFDLGYPPAVVKDFMNFANDAPDGSHALENYSNDFVLIPPDLRAVKLIDSQPGWRLIYRDDVARLYAPLNSPAAHLDGVPFTGTVHPAFFP
ncbi:MAG TPA: hypothetical protein VGR40_03355, partial [Candidatus Binatus sp.]|nr:hypothetical protein [Candidatus Binatus sp.]